MRAKKPAIGTPNKSFNTKGTVSTLQTDNTYTSLIMDDEDLKTYAFLFLNKTSTPVINKTKPDASTPLYASKAEREPNTAALLPPRQENSCSSASLAEAKADDPEIDDGTCGDIVYTNIEIVPRPDGSLVLPAEASYYSLCCDLDDVWQKDDEDVAI